MKKLIAVTVSLLSLAAGVHAAEFKDDFNRPDASGTGANTLSTIGNNWIGQGARRWDISNGSLVANSGDGRFIYNSTVGTLNSAADASFIMSADITLNSENQGIYGGLTVNYDPVAETGLVFRINGLGEVQLLRPNATATFSSSMSEPFVSDRAYTMTVASDASHAYDLTIFDPVLNKLVFSTNVVNGGGSAASDGFGGFWVNTFGAAFDNFSIWQGTRFKDNFNRANVTGTGSAAAIGDGYDFQNAGTNTVYFDISSNTLKFRGGNGGHIRLFNRNTLTESGNGKSFTVFGDVTTISTLNNSALYGLAFNVQDDGSYYVLRINTGSADNPAAATAIFRQMNGADIIRETVLATNREFAVDSTYTLNVSSETPGKFDVKVFDVNGTPVLLSSVDWSSHADVLTGGYGGFYINNGNQNVTFDNLIIQESGSDPSGFCFKLKSIVPGTSLAPDQTFIYKQIGGTQLELYVFYPQDIKPGDRRPGAVFFFGGGWVDGTANQFFPQCRYLATRGMVACSANYRVRNRNQSTPLDSVKDAKSVMRWMRANSGILHVDPIRIAAGGGSAGGHLAAVLGNDVICDEAGEDLSISARPELTILFNPPTDIATSHAQWPDITEAEWRTINPIDTLMPATSPMILFHGTGDEAVPYTQSVAYHELAQTNGVRSDLFLYEGKPHGFFNFGTRANFNDTMTKVDRFLNEFGWVSGDPTVETFSP